MDGNKLPLFVIFKAKVRKSVESDLPSILPAVIHGYVQTNAWVDERCMRI